MDIEHIKILKRQLEIDIEKLLTDFEAATTIYVKSIEVDNTVDEQELYIVEVEIFNPFA